MGWLKVFDQQLVAEPGTRPGGYIPLPPVVVANLTGKTITFQTQSTKAKPSWWLAFRLTVRSQVADFPGGPIAAVSTQRKVPINQNSLFDLSETVAPYELELRIPDWYEEMSIRIWQSESSPISSNDRALLEVVSVGQTVFQLAIAPAAPHTSELFINGTKATYPSEYQISGAVLTWLHPLILEPGDEVELIY